LYLGIGIGTEEKKYLGTVTRYVNLYLVTVPRYKYLGTTQHCS